MNVPNGVIASSYNLNFLNGSGSKAWPQDSGGPTEEICLCGPEQSNHFVPRSEKSSLQSFTPKMVCPPGESATEAIQDPALDSCLEMPAETPMQQPATDLGAPGVPDILSPGPKQGHVGPSDQENKWIPDEDISRANHLQEMEISPGGAHRTKQIRKPVNPPLGASNKRFEARHRSLNVREQLPREKTRKLAAVNVKGRRKLRGDPETHGTSIEKQKDAHEAALKALNIGVDANWPDESQILDQIGRQNLDGETTQLKWQIDKQKKVGTSGSEKSFKDCVVTIETDSILSQGEFSNTEGVTGLNIISGPLQEVLRQVIVFDPTVILYQDPISLQKPFGVLFHNMPAFEKYSLRAEANDSGVKDLRVLLYICKKLFARLFQSISLSLAAGDVFDEALIALYRPGSLLLAKDVYGQPHIFVFLSARIETVRYRDAEREEFMVRAWYLQWNYLYQRLERHLAHFSLGSYVGTRKIRELPIYPLDYYGTDAAQQELKTQMIERNRRWTRIVSQKPSCWKHEGLAVRGSDWVKIKHHGRVVVQEEQAIDADDLFTDAKIMPEKNVRDWDSRPDYLCYDKLAIDGELTDDQILLCTSTIWCFDLQEQNSLLVSISDLQPADWNKSALNHLVLDQDKKELICAVAKHHSKDFPSQTRDIIEGKGSGLVIVLHGPPGVGKTLTAECLAEYIEKPLIHLRISDLVTNESTFMDSMTRRLQFAEKLGAIILLDEADVILESRSFEDVKRNGIVSAFLRTLEYFDGIIIMTTNRIETMDTAFLSRIGVPIEYKNLSTGSRRKIWEMFINRLESAEAREELLDEMDFLKKSNMNGRQIRNVMKVSESLAKTDGREHICVADVKRAMETASLQKVFEERKELSRRNLRVNLRGAGQDARRRDEDDED